MEHLNNDIDKKIESLENRIKENESNIFLATKTFLSDMYDFNSGKKEAFPHASLNGLIFAFLRRRMLIVVGSLLAAVFSFMQLVLFHKQNNLLENQALIMERQLNLDTLNIQILEKQTLANQMEATTSILNNLNIRDTFRTELALAQLNSYNQNAFKVFMNLAEQNEISQKLAYKGLLYGVNSHSGREVSKCLNMFLRKLYVRNLRIKNAECANNNDEVLLDFTIAYVKKIINRISNDEGFRSDLASESAVDHTLFKKPLENMPRAIIFDVYKDLDSELRRLNCANYLLDNDLLFKSLKELKELLQSGVVFDVRSFLPRYETLDR